MNLALFAIAAAIITGAAWLLKDLFTRLADEYRRRP